ncbi:amino acid adenylation domain-containing protein [Calothrix sp. FACHB-1219]|uniref:non-ribosomal peptide synthetase n=1 Tax=unclassified Calothrix TaxID=2619626 RepID=UPI00168A0F3E|nr:MULTISPECIES: non-ribosomal peptide synthetase [unclassified Calothrix]MBD2207319.1 amino acid adenylation domain-containing protein [Calothrix sp. FACHB-168]MBD2221940.1 amino acid adenylation domain-containing protein [Calothrix sp. FACHB-1219]
MQADIIEGFQISPQQKRLWLQQQNSVAYCAQLAIRIAGNLNIQQIQEALHQVGERHEIFRTSLQVVDEIKKPIQVIQKSLNILWRYVDLSGCSKEKQQNSINDFWAEESRYIFDLKEIAILRPTLITLSQQEYILAIALHSLYADGWTLNNLVREIITLYKIQNQQSLAAPIQYIQFSELQNELIESVDSQTAIKGWRNQDIDSLLNLKLVMENQLLEPREFAPKVLSCTINYDLEMKIKAILREHNISGNVFFLACWQVLLWRLTGQSDLIVGIICNNRVYEELQDMMGLFAKCLPVQCCLEENAKFSEVITKVSESISQVEEWQEYFCWEQLINEAHNREKLPFFPYCFEFEERQTTCLADEISFTVDKKYVCFDQFKVKLSCVDIEGGLTTEFHYDSSLFSDTAIENLVEQFYTLLESAVSNSNILISNLQILSATERQKLLFEWNNTKADYHQKQCLHQLFESVVEQTPNAVAVVFEDEQLTYSELNARANQLAHYLQQLGVKPEVLVGICVERSLFLIIALLGILKAGAAYVPLDPTYPRERLALMLTDAQVPILLTQQHLVKDLPECQTKVICLDSDSQIAQNSQSNPINQTTPENLAYVIYTSGSTGTPKGVLVTHGNVTRLLKTTESWFNFNHNDVWTLFHSIAFDFSVWEIWGALLYGGRLVIVPYWLCRSPKDFYNLLCQEKVTVLNQTPGAFRQLIQVEASSETGLDLVLRWVIFGGEALNLQSLKPWFELHGDRFPQLVNMYGITETTVHVTYRPLSIADLQLGLGSVIGRPIPDLQVYLLDSHQQPVPIGVPGEIYVGGAGLARGYLNRPDLTAAKFINNPFWGAGEAGGEFLTPHSTVNSQQSTVNRQQRRTEHVEVSTVSTLKSRLYKTGDLARFLPNGELEYLGRIDEQVKVRGFRIELGEIEAVLAQHPAVREAVAIAQEENYNKQLVAYVVPSNQQILKISELRSFLTKQLPDYMVPGLFVILDTLPLTSNGKINRQILAAPDKTRPELDEAFVAPSTPQEQILAKIWVEVLGVERVGIYDNFFALGGDSIFSIRVQSLSQQQGLSFTIEQLFQYPTIYELAQNVTIIDVAVTANLVQDFSLICEEDKVNLPDNLEDAYPLSKLQMGMLFHSEYDTKTAAYHDIFSYQCQSFFDFLTLQAATQQLGMRHPILRTAFNFTDYTEPLQLVHRKVDIPLDMEDLRHLSNIKQDEVVAAWIESEKQRSFDWQHPPLLRLQIHRLTEERFQFTLSFHHAILDGWSVASMLTELFQIYFGLLGKKVALIQPPSISKFRDFVAFEKKVIASPECRNYWLEKLRDRTISNLPRWYPRQQLTSKNQVVTQEVFLSAEVSQKLQQLSQSENLPLKSILLAAHLRVLSFLNGQPDIITGLVSNGRLEEADGERVLGLFLNTLPLRVLLTGGTWIELVRSILAAEQELLPFRRYPLAELQRLLGNQPLFETAFNFVHFHVYQGVLQVEGMQLLETKFFGATNFNFVADFGLVPASSQITLHLSYKTTEFSAEQIQTIGDYYLRTLVAIANQPTERYEYHSLLSAQEQHQLLVEWNPTESNYPQQCIHQLFEAQVERSPDAIAAIYEGEQLTYQQLNQRGNQLAHYLQKLGVKPEVLVGICVERSLEMLVGLLGILKAGGAYVPLDPEYPQERLNFMLCDARVSILLTQEKLVTKVSEYQGLLICLDTKNTIFTNKNTENIASIVQPENLAYVIYTSGSTGKPKGVMIPHQGLVNYLHWCTQAYAVADGCGSPVHSSLGFDATITSLFSPLLVGQTVVLLPSKQEIEVLSNVLNSQSNFSLIKITPAHLEMLSQLLSVKKIATQVKAMVIGGDALSANHLAFWRNYMPNTRIFNEYGPTETVVGCCVYEVLKETDIANSIPIGRAIANTHLYILDSHLQLVPVGTPGELYIGGAGVARGYLNQPQLTADKFIPHPFSNFRLPILDFRLGDSSEDSESCETHAQFSNPKSQIQNLKWNRLYKTGDLARYLTDGNIEYLGRSDRQVKIRGFRIELGEIEALLNQHPDIRQTVVFNREDRPGDKRLVAYIVPLLGKIPSFSHLRDFLKEKLPQYMVPSAFVVLEALPLTANGKIDHQQLPPPEDLPTELTAAYVAPQSQTEIMLANIWQVVLNVEKVGIYDNFFDLGGHSLLAVQVYSQLREIVYKDISIVDLFTYPTISSFAKYLNQGDTFEPEIKSLPTSRRAALRQQRQRRNSYPATEN